MAESPPEYIVRDYSAIDKQIEEVARREQTVTDKMRIKNYEKMAIIGGGLALVAGIVFVLICWGLRIMKGPPEVKVIEVLNNNSQIRQNDINDIKQIRQNDINDIQQIRQNDINDIQEGEDLQIYENNNFFQEEIKIINQYKQKNEELEKRIRELERSKVPEEEKKEAIKELRKKITNNKKAIQLSKKKINNNAKESSNQDSSIQNVKKNIVIFKQVKINDELFSSIMTRHEYNESSKSKPDEESCYASALKEGNRNEMFELAEKDKSGKVKTLYKANNFYKLTKAQWDSYARNCQWF